ncbi:N-methyl-L-tryptophan oxidase [Amycolatopsis keratiniphila]|uniref:N-methyltryptophan oxidase n=1 Tax=Amycolatopsis keratiniphila subsp. keratiniphila TaxID=227715 RepID=A0A1W2LG36_9PSEU|nr:N-methyl-L-tryptophan oxidase [Amycolatopsis keratiniphila]ONF61817.1 N-methyltryptophan oxidase [Amycolatopsis keratiniphila subsp. keratiniphila]
MSHYDVIVIGLGGMGSAAAYRLARRGQRVLGIDRFAPVHNLGSSHGGSRITRQAYFEDPAYVPLLLRAHELWAGVERDSGRKIFTRCGGIMLGGPDSRTVSGSLASARTWDLPHELLDAAEIRRRFPTMHPADHEIALYEENAGFVVPEGSVAAHLQLAARAGADLHHEEEVLSWRETSTGVRVGTSQNFYTAGQLVICPGAWAPGLLTELGVEFTIERQVQYWFAPSGGVAPFRAERHPIYVWEGAGGRQFYGFPSHDDAGSVKVAFFRGGEPCTPESIDRTVHAEEVAEISEFVGRKMPALPGTFLRGATCMYTNTPDEHFVIARHPAHERVVVACGFSGHGFKFVPVVGEILADLVVDGTTTQPIGLFDPARFAGVAR